MSMKKIIGLITIFSFILIIGLIYFLNKDNSQTEKSLIDLGEANLKKDNIEVYDEVLLSDIVDLNGKKLINDYKIDTSKVGNIKLDINYYDSNNNERSGFINIEIKDLVPPVINIGKSYNHIIDTDFTFEGDILCADNYDKNVRCGILGDYDLDKLGSNNVKVFATDSSGNKTEKDIVINVIEKPSNTKKKREYINLEDAMKNLQKDEEIMIDVSKWQGEIDWEKVHEAGVNYAMMRLGTQKAIDEDSVIDQYFERNIKEAKKNGIKVGVYYFSYANDIQDAKIQAEWVVDKLKDYKIDLPVTFDWECFGYFNQFNLNIHELNQISKTFYEILEDNGYDVMQYGSKNTLLNFWDTTNIKVWLAHYTEKTDYDKAYVMWQFSDSGKVPGIKEAVDLNYIYLKNF